MGLGGFHPYPKRYGGGRPLLKVMHDALNAARGTAIDAADSTSAAWVENMAYARAIVFDGHGTMERLGNQRDPSRMTDFIPRWEGIFKIIPSPTATDSERRAAIRARFRRFLDASALHSRVESALRAAIPTYFSAIEYISYANAVIHVPDASYPWGTVVNGYPWTSTTAHLLVLLVKPTGATEGDFYNAAAKVPPILDAILPAWMTFDWYRRPAGGPAVNVSGGPSQGGFYLDDPHNLDNNVFSQ